MPGELDRILAVEVQNLDPGSKSALITLLQSINHGLEFQFKGHHLRLLTSMVGGDLALYRLLKEFMKLDEDEKNVFADFLYSLNLRGVRSTLPLYEHMIWEKVGRDAAAAMAAEFFLGSLLTVRMASAEGHESREKCATVAKGVFTVLEAILPG